MFFLVLSSIAVILQFRRSGTGFWVTVTSAHGSPTASSWVDSGTDFTASVTSPDVVVANDHRWVCIGYSVDGGVLVPGTSYTFTTVTASHSIDFTWKEQFYMSVSSAHGSPTASSWVDSGTDFTAFVTSPDVVLVNNIKWVCLGYSVDGGAINSGTSYTFTAVAASHSIDFSWEEQPVGTQIKIVNKQIPPGYVMGFGFDAGLMNGMNVLFIQNSNEKISIRFTAKLSGNITRLVIYGFAYKGQPTVRIGLQEDDGGNPKGQWMNENSFGDVQLSSSSGFKTVQLGTQATITNDTVYHIVVEATDDPWNGTAAVITYQANGFAQPLNPDDPDIIWNDTRMNIISYDGNTWREQNKWPIFIVEYSNGTSEGQPYSLAAPWVVWGSTYVGQALIPASDYNLSKIAFDISLKSAAPQDKLYYQVRNSSNAILAEGVFAEQAQLTVSQTWIEATLPTPVTLKAGQIYRIFVLSPQTDLNNAYFLYGHEFSYNSSIGYGGLQHRLTSSLDGGATWGENPDADAIFKMTNAG